MSSVSDKTILLAEPFYGNSNHSDSGSSLHALPARMNVKQNNIIGTLKMVKKAIDAVYFCKASVRDCILGVVLKICKLGFSYILANLFSISFKESFFPRLFKSLIFGPYF